MYERFGCRMSHVALTMVVVFMPVIMGFKVAMPMKVLCFMFVGVIALLTITPFEVLVTEQGLTFRSLMRARFVAWSQILKIKFDSRSKTVMMAFNGGRTFIPFGIWFYNDSLESFSGLKSLLEQNVPPDLIDSSSR